LRFLIFKFVKNNIFCYRAHRLSSRGFKKDAIEVCYVKLNDLKNLTFKDYIF